MNLEQIYSFSNNRQIWRLLPTDSGKIIIEERDTENKEVFFNCLNIFSGEKILSNYQLEEKFWVGIEHIKDDVIYFHKFIKPDMPIHSGIIAFSINSRTILWENSDLSFLFFDDNKIYCYKSTFEGRNFFILDSKSGEVVGGPELDTSDINLLRDKSLSQQSFKDYIFPQTFFSDESLTEKVSKNLTEIKNEKVIAGKIEYAIKKDGLFFNFHEVLSNGKLRNIFRGIDLTSNKKIIEEILNTETQAFVPDSFFFKQNLMFLLQEKIKLVVYKLKS